MRRCCVVPRMEKQLIKMLDKEFPNHKEYKTSGVTTNKEQVHIHIDDIILNYSFLKKVEALHYEIIHTWTQAHNAISLAVIPDAQWMKSWGTKNG